MSNQKPVTPSSVYLNDAVITALKSGAWTIDPVARIVMQTSHGVTLGIVLIGDGRTGAGLIDCLDDQDARNRAVEMGCTHYQVAQLGCNPFGEPLPLV